MQEFGLTVHSRFSNISNESLDEMVQEIKDMNPRWGPKLLVGYLRSRGTFVQRERVRQALVRVDPIGVVARRCRAVHRRVYSVTRPLALWHFDGHHKRIKWRFVIHGCIDGYSRIPVFLKCSSNNRAQTVFSNFIEAVEKWGRPWRTRCDQGGENVDVVQYMIEKPGPGRGSALVGRIVHNQRIERLWRDVYKDVASVFHGLFSLMEEVGILDPIAETDIWCLHLIFGVCTTHFWDT